MTTRRTLLFLIIAFALAPLVLPVRQLAVGDSTDQTDGASPESAAVLELVKKLDQR